MGLILCFLQSCSTEELLIESESNRNKRDYSYEEITFQDLKKINNNAFIESAKLKKVIATSKNKDINSASDYDIDLKSIRYIKRKNNDETFSFRIFQVPTATFQQNIVVECKENEKPQSYLVTYYLNKQVNQINNSDDFIKAIKSTSVVKIADPLKTHRTTNGGCIQIGYYDDVELCEGDLDTRPRCYNSDGSRATIKVFKVIDSACSTGGVSDFTPLASQWNQYNTAPSDPYSGNTGSPAGGEVAAESTALNIFAPNYYENGDLNDPAIQNMLQINQFLSSLYISSNEIKGAVDSSEWLLAYTNYWIGTNGGLTPSNQIALTYAFNNIPMLFNQYNGTSYELNAINNFKFSSFQFLLFHGEFLSKLDPLTQKSILDEITSLEKIELMNNVVNFMIQNREVELKVDSSITAQNALTFTNFSEFENLIKDINVEGYSYENTVPGEITANARIRITPFGGGVKIRILQNEGTPFTIKEVTSVAYGITVGFTWTQTGSPKINKAADKTTIVIDGILAYTCLFQSIGVFSEVEVSYEVIINNSNGTIISIKKL
jgi:hypothetical protein